MQAFHTAVLVSAASLCAQAEVSPESKWRDCSSSGFPKSVGYVTGTDTDYAADWAVNPSKNSLLDAGKSSAAELQAACDALLSDNEIGEIYQIKPSNDPTCLTCLRMAIYPATGAGKPGRVIEAGAAKWVCTKGAQAAPLLDCPPTECYQRDMDVGGDSVENKCGFMDVVQIVAAEGEEQYEWYKGYFKNVPAEDIDSAEKCQALCEETPACQYFAYSPPDPYADCTLKAGYASGLTCDPLYEAYSGSIAGPKRCQSCFKEEMDVGGGFNHCGYMDNVAIFAKPGEVKQSWYNGFYRELPDVATWTVDRCQHLCSQSPDCGYWHMSEGHCYLKADYSKEKQAEFKADGGCVPLYKPFDKVRDFKYVSGPAKCMEVSQTMSCGDVKARYKKAMCCDAPNQRVEM